MSAVGRFVSSMFSAAVCGDVDSIVLMRTIVRFRRFSSEPTFAARSATDGSQPIVRRSSSRAASSSRRTRRTPRGQASRRSASIIAPRTRRSANVSNLIPRLSSNRWAASMRPMTPSCTRSPMSIECGIEAAIRRASASTNGRVFTTRALLSRGCVGVLIVMSMAGVLQPRCHVRAALRRRATKPISFV